MIFFSSSGDEIAELDLDWEEYLHSQEPALAELARRAGTGRARDWSSGHTRTCA